MQDQKAPEMAFLRGLSSTQGMAEAAAAGPGPGVSGPGPGAGGSGRAASPPARRKAGADSSFLSVPAPAAPAAVESDSARERLRGLLAKDADFDAPANGNIYNKLARRLYNREMSAKGFREGILPRDL